jgi:hypothetical protein
MSRSIGLCGALVAAVVLSCGVAAGASRAAQAGAPQATLATFAGHWAGHTRTLVVRRDGVAKESVGDGCCDPVVNLRLRLSHPRGTTRRATVLARVTRVRVLDASAFSKAHPAPRVGESRRLHLRRGVITEPLTRSAYCNREGSRRQACGA